MRKMILVSTILVVAVCLAIVLTTHDAWAQAKKDGKNVSKEKEIASREGVAGSLGKKEWDKNKLPSKLKLAFGFGSLFAGIAVFKWL